MSAWRRAVVATAVARASAVAREAAVAAFHQRVSSLLTLAIVAAVCAAVLLTAGRSEGSAREVLSRIDDSGTRSIVVRAEAAAGIDATVLDRMRAVGGIEWFGAFGPADDVSNAAVGGGSPVALRIAYGAAASFGGRASPAAAGVLGLADGVGAVVSRESGAVHEIGGIVDLPPDLRFLDPVVLVAPGVGRAVEPGTAAGPVTLLVVRATTPADVEAVAAAVTALLGADDPTTVTVQTSELLASVRGQVESQLSDTGRGLVVSTFAGSALVLAAMLTALVLLRRRDFGRRRALGATRSLIVLLLLSQVGLLAVVASAVGCGAALATLIVTRQPLPPPDFTAAVAVLATMTSLVAGVVPAAVASTRDPLRELRVP